MVKLRELTTQEIEKLASRPNVRRIAVENFLMTNHVNGTLLTALANLKLDTNLYNWDTETVKAISIGIKTAIVETPNLRGSNYEREYIEKHLSGKKMTPIEQVEHMIYAEHNEDCKCDICQKIQKQTDEYYANYNHDNFCRDNPEIARELSFDR